LTIEEFADLQCPYCQRFALEVLPLVIQRYVRTGAVRLLFRPLAFIGGDSLTAARAVVAAGRQDTAWQLIDLLYRNQGAENSGWVTNDLLDGAARALGMDAGKAATFANGDAAGSALGRASAEASRLGVSSTPTLVLLRAGHRPQLIENALDEQALFATLDAARN
jgi:protein-disulfide isomerase